MESFDLQWAYTIFRHSVILSWIVNGGNLQSYIAGSQSIERPNCIHSVIYFGNLIVRIIEFTNTFFSFSF